MATNLEISGALKRTQAGNTDYYYGGGSYAWASLAAAKAGVPSAIRPGKIVGVLIGGLLREYYWPNPSAIADGDLVVFSPGTATPAIIAKTRAELQAIEIATDFDTTIFYLCTDADTDSRRLLLTALDNTSLNPAATDTLTGHVGTWDITTDTFTAYGVSTFQPLDADLTAIAALGFASTSFLKKTGAGTWALDVTSYQDIAAKVGNLNTPSSTDYPNVNAVIAAINDALAGLKNKEARVASVGNLTLSGTQTIDGVACIANDRVLAKDQSTGSENGIWVVAAGAWTRATDYDSASEIQNSVVNVSEGTQNADSSWRQTVDTVIVGTTALSYVQFGASVPNATPTTAGKAKLYAALGANTDGAIDQATVTTGLAAKVAKAGDSMTGALLLAQGANIASAATINLALATGNALTITGSTGPITSLGTVAAGAVFTLTFASTPTLTHNATSLILPTGANIVVAAGDVAEFTSLGSGNWKCTGYLRADGLPLAQPAAPYLKYVALLNQAGGDDPQSATSGALVVGVSYQIAVYNAGDDFTNVGAASNATGVKFVATGTTPTTWSNSSELAWNNGAPIVTPLENTLGNVVWERIGASAGEFKAVCSGLFTVNKTGFLIQPASSDLHTGFIVNPSGDADTLNITTIDDSLTSRDEMLINTMIEIRVYP